MFTMQNRVRNGHDETVISDKTVSVVLSYQDGHLVVYAHRNDNGNEMLPNGYMLGANALRLKVE